MCLTGEMDDVVKPELRGKWDDAKNSWFVQDENDPWQTRLPGLMKQEWATRNGAMVA